MQGEKNAKMLVCLILFLVVTKHVGAALFVYPFVCLRACVCVCVRLSLSLMLTQREEAAPSGNWSPTYLPQWLVLLRP